MTISSLPTPVVYIIKQLQLQGFEAYVVGGAVRDVIMDRPTNDWDFTTDATPEQIQACFPNCFYENEYGTVGIAATHVFEEMKQADTLSQAEYEAYTSDEAWQTQVFEITTFRTETTYSDNRRPDSVTWGTSIHEDLQRRDFSMNAIAVTLDTDNSQFLIIDPYKGIDAIKARHITAVGEAKIRFEEDALRMMRAIRFASQLGFSIEPETLQAIHQQSERIKYISKERVRDELLKIIASEQPAEGIVLLDQVGLLAFILPELLAGKGVKQGGRHKYDVWKHSIESLRECPSSNPIVRLATLLHDIGKPATVRYQGPRGVTFYGHEVVGARMIKKIANRLRLSKDEVNKLFILVRWHMFTYDKDMTDAAIRRFIKHVGLENINDMMLLRVGDRKGGGSKASSWRLRELQRRIGENLYQPLAITDLQVNGHDIMEQLKIAPSRIIGDILKQLLEEVIEDPATNDRAHQLNRISQLYAEIKKESS